MAATTDDMESSGLVSQGDDGEEGVSITAIITQPRGDDDCDSPDSSNGSTPLVVSSPAGEGTTAAQFIVTVPVEDQDEVNTVHPTYVQYTVDGTEQAIYATNSNGQITYPVFAMSGNYTPASGTYYTAGTTPTAVTYTPPAQGIITTAGSTYLIQSTVEADIAQPTLPRTPDTVGAQETGVYMVANAAMESDRVDSVTHATRVSPATVQWLLENYECAEGVSLPRSTMYTHYLRHCSDHKLDPVNAASFGKLIRSVFLGLRTRRLGTRGNSKYHYYGIRIKPGSGLTRMSEESSSGGTGNRANNAKRFKATGTGKAENQYDGNAHNTSPQTHDNQQYLGDGMGAIPDFPEIHTPAIMLDDEIEILRNMYREHCEAFLEAVLNLEFNMIEGLWRDFWRSSDNNNGEECEEEKYLSKEKLYELCKLQGVQDFIQSVDFLFYQNIVQVLIPDVLRPIPTSLTQSIRNFAKGLEHWLTSAMTGCPEPMLKVKMAAVSALAQTLRRYTSLNHLAQAARAVLQNSSQISQMLADLNRVDFHNVQEQASWVCECDDDMVDRLQADFKATLQQQNSLEAWAVWLKNVVGQILKPYEGRPNFPKAARQFLLKWSFYSSMVIRDLTLRSAASFGSFHLIRLLYDEYMFYLVEHQIALATGESPIAVMGVHGITSLDPLSFQTDKKIKLS